MQDRDHVDAGVSGHGNGRQSATGRGEAGGGGTDAVRHRPLVSVTLLGSLSVAPSVGSAAFTSVPFPTRKSALLLAYLLCFPMRRSTRDTLADTLWSDLPPEKGRSNLRVTLTRLRQHLDRIAPGAGAAIDVADRRVVALRPGVLAASDYERIGRALERVEAIAKAPEPDPALLIAAMREATQLYRGPLLDDFDEIWILAEREHLQQRYVAALRTTLRTAYEAKDLATAEEMARRVLSVDPQRESAHRDLIRLLMMQRRLDLARRQLEDLEHLLRGQNLEPSRATQELAAQMAAAAPLGATPVIASPERVGSPTPPLPPPVPTMLSRFFGREEDLREIMDLLLGRRDGDVAGTPSRLVTLTGHGGNGKTRLARQVALALHAEHDSPFRGSIWWLELTDVSAPETMLAQLIEMVRSQVPVVTTALPTSGSSAIDRAALALHDAAMRSGCGGASLMVLDNAEAHLSEAVKLALSLLQRVPGLSCLVTSRVPLGIQGEQEFAILPLPAPPPRDFPLDDDQHDGVAALAALETYPSVQLLIDRIRCVQRRFRLTNDNAAAVANLCARLDGSPLAIELAASWAGALTPQQMLDRMAGRRFELLVSQHSDTPERHRSLRAVVQTSEELLSPGARQLFHRLSVFRGGFTLEAAEAVGVTGADDVSEGAEGEGAFLQRFRELVSAMFVVATEVDGRYRMLETMREWGSAQLTPRERLALRRRHAYYYLEACVLRKRPAVDQVIRSHGLWMHWERDTENLIAAWEYFQGSPEQVDIKAGLRLGRSVYEWLYGQGYHSLVRDRMERQLERAAAATDAFQTASGTAEAPDWLDEQLRALFTVCWRELHANPPQGHRRMDEIERLQRQFPLSLDTMATVHVMRGHATHDLHQRQNHFERALALSEECGATDNPSYLTALYSLADIARQNHEFYRQRELMLRCRQVVRDLEAKGVTTDTLRLALIPYRLALAEIELGNLSSARRLLQESMAICLNSGKMMLYWLARAAEARLFEVSGDDASAAAVARLVLTEHAKYNERVGGMLALEVLMRVVVRQGQEIYAAQLMGAWESLVVIYGIYPEGCAQDADLVSILSLITEHTRSPECAAARLMGRALGIPEIVQLALDPSAFDPDVTQGVI